MDSISQMIEGGYKTFKPYVPLFIQWTDLWVREQPTSGTASKYYTSITAALQKVLRPDVMYVTVSQNDVGIPGNVLDPRLLRNVIVLSAGGYGHVPIPLMMREELLAAKRLRPASRLLSFVGTVHGCRIQMKEQVVAALDLPKAAQPTVRYTVGNSEDWRANLTHREHTLAPAHVHTHTHALARMRAFSVACFTLHSYERAHTT